MTTKKPSEIRPDRKGWFKPYIAGTWQLYLMMLIPIIYIICFKYKPMLGIVMAFKKYTPFGGRSMWEMEWVGFQWFQEAFRDSLFWKSLGNTLVLNLGDLVFGFPFPIILAIFLNELRSNKVRKTTQLSLYLPNFRLRRLRGSVPVQHRLVAFCVLDHGYLAECRLFPDHLSRCPHVQRSLPLRSCLH